MKRALLTGALAGALAAAFALVSPLAMAQQYPTKPVRVLVSFPPGSGVDVAARIMSEKLSAAMGQPFVVENRAGGAGTVAAAAVAVAPADGYTLLVNTSSHTLYPSLYSSLSFDPAKDLVGVAPIAELPLVLVTSPEKKWQSLKDLFDYAKANPGKFNYGSAGVGTTSHIALERVRHSAGVTGVHIPFKGTPEALAEVMGGRIDATYTQISTAIPLVKDNKLRALAVGGRARSPALPDVPTTTELGFADSAFTGWVGILAPARTPRAIVERLNQEALKALASPDVLERLAKAGQDPMPMNLARFEAQIKAEFEAYPALIKAAGVKPQ